MLLVNLIDVLIVIDGTISIWIMSKPKFVFSLIGIVIVLKDCLSIQNK